MDLLAFTFLFVSLICAVVSDAVCGEECDSSNVLQGNGTSRILSRRKRYLIFPDGSSLQLVFCVQTAALIPIGDIFLFGNTAALAWNLPTDPQFLLKFKEYEKHPNRRVDSQSIYYVDAAGKVLAKVPYRRPAIVNPAFAKRSVDDAISYRQKLKAKIDRAKMHEEQVNEHFLKEHLDGNSVEFHRSSRVELLEKIESLITALGHDGRQCVLYKLCESAKSSARQGTFLQELLRVIFTLPKGKEFEIEDHKEYDEAHSISKDCAALYPGCEDFQIPIQL